MVIKRIFASLAFSVAFFMPLTARAALWDWVPRVIPTTDYSQVTDASRFPGYECKARNSWGDCIVYSYINPNTPTYGRNPYRSVTSFEGQLYSDCQFNDYKRDTARHTRPSTCDYGTPKWSDTHN